MDFNYLVSDCTPRQVVDGLQEVFTRLDKPSDAQIVVQLANKNVVIWRPGREARGSLAGLENLSTPLRGYRATLKYGGHSIAYDVTQNQDHARINLNIPDQAGGEGLAQAVACAQGVFPPAEYLSELKSAFGAHLGQTLGQMAVQVGNTRQVIDEALGATHDHQLRLEQDFIDRKQALEKEHSDRLAELESQHRDRQKQLDEREAELDAIDARAARRRDFEKISAQLKELTSSYELTKGTVAMRKPVEYACYGLMGATALLFTTLLFPDVATPLGWAAHVLRGSALVGFAATAWFYVRWNNQWFAYHASEEFRLKRLGLDVGRANWLVELAMEWAEQRNKSIPSELVTYLARNLFVEGKEHTATPTPPEDALRALLGMSSELDLALPGGSRAKVNRKHIPKPGKE